MLPLTDSDISRLTKPDCVSFARRLLDEAEREHRQLSAAEEGQYAKLTARIDQCNREPVNPGSLQRHGETAPFATRPARLSTFGYRHNGRWIVDVGPDQPFAASSGRQPEQGPLLGDLIRGSITGNWDGMTAERAAIQESQDSTGGFLIPSATMSGFIDRARARMVLAAAGARTIQLPPAQEFGIGRLNGDVTASWRVETAHITASTPTFEKIWLRPKVLACLVPITIEFLEDAGNAATLIEDACAAALAVELDRAMLRGAGTPAITGISNTTDVTTTAVGGAWSYDTLCDGWKKVLDNNGPSFPTACLLSTASENNRRKKKDGDGNYLALSDTPFANVPFLPTTSIPDTLSPGTATELYLGDFTRCLMGVRTDFKVEILAAGTGSTGAGDTFNATTQLGRWLRIYGRFDTHLEQPGHFWVGTGVTNA